jgi:membrane-bound metal-dependent hydrolase YbcI (DUF457 family)
MFAVDHSATALLIKRRFPSVSMTPLLVSVQAMELAWVALNYLGIERTTTASTVRSVADIHLAYIPYSHSVATVIAAAVVIWWIIERGFGRRSLGRAVAIGIVSHLVLDVATHAPDIALWPGSSFPQLGLGLYSGAPSAAFVVELLYGVLCWWVYRGSRALFSVVVAGNLANVSFFFAGVAGPEQFLAGRPMLVVTLIFGQIVTMLVLVGLFSSKPALRNVPPQAALQQAALRRLGGTFCRHKPPRHRRFRPCWLKPVSSRGE